MAPPHQRHAVDFWLPVERRRAFRFLADVRNLDPTTPEWLSFTPRAVPSSLGEGTRIDYRLRYRFLRLRWQSEIVVWEPPVLFTYEQRRGPYAAFRHEHVFEQEDGGTRVIDRVRWRAWGGPLVRRLVAAEVERIFAHRADAVRRLLDVGTATPSSPRRATG